MDNSPMKINIREEELKALLNLAFVHGKNDFPDKQATQNINKWVEDLKNDRRNGNKPIN